ncbi:glycosyltransferase family 2 protein [Photobacterium ganghwense]|uniref:Glycosyl transferase family 2 n=1 Tax=Photobacterium ganghwense TaxID=320778 RepID=A0A0J1HH54_9GAMM|nr:glycosyltransferase family 2 protein [Photobacterium ganghwense]KLV10945.1 glycosyl transferase family 2 [Photobacterium ganghwense]PSU11198.1 glycosyltransferase family 2 protein [Photobacterium ganghwense]QSV13326.1 glycosyltransferase family 2 protein [Photobacterium ganghwense]
MLISIITATYNSIDFIDRTYQSILDQSYTNWEWLITDDCSFDGTYEKLLLLAEKDCRIKVFKNEVNSGAAVSRNKSISSAKGRYLAFIDSDDVWHPKKLELQIDFMSDEVVFSFTPYQIISENDTFLGKVVDKDNVSFVGYKDMLKKEATLGCSTVMLDLERFSNLQMPNLRTGQDYACWLMLLRQGNKAYCLNEVLTSYRITAGSISRNKLKKAKRQWQIYREVEGLDYINSFHNFVYYALRAVFRK